MSSNKTMPNNKKIDSGSSGTDKKDIKKKNKPKIINNSEKKYCSVKAGKFGARNFFGFFKHIFRIGSKGSEATISIDKETKSLYENIIEHIEDPSENSVDIYTASYSDRPSSKKKYRKINEDIANNVSNPKDEIDDNDIDYSNQYIDEFESN